MRGPPQTKIADSFRLSQERKKRMNDHVCSHKSRPLGIGLIISLATWLSFGPNKEETLDRRWPKLGTSLAFYKGREGPSLENPKKSEKGFLGLLGPGIKNARKIVEKRQNLVI